MTSLHQGGEVNVRSDNALIIIPHTPLSPYTRHLRIDIGTDSSCTLFSLPQPHHITAPHTSLGDKPERPWAGESVTRPGQCNSPNLRPITSTFH